MAQLPALCSPWLWGTVASSLAVVLGAKQCVQVCLCQGRAVCPCCAPLAVSLQQWVGSAYMCALPMPTSPTRLTSPCCRWDAVLPSPVLLTGCCCAGGAMFYMGSVQHPGLHPQGNSVHGEQLHVAAEQRAVGPVAMLLQ